MMSILTLAVMVLLVATMRPGFGKGTVRQSKPAARQGDRIIAGRGVKLGPPQRDPNNPSVVTYELMKERKLPSATQRALRRLGRPFGWFNRRFAAPKPQEPGNPSRRTTGESVELQNFLEARNREIARRKSEDPAKRGPEDTLH